MNTNNYYNEIRNEIGKEFGLEALGYGAPRPTLSIVQCQMLLNKYGMDKATLIAKRYANFVKVVK